MLEVRNLAAFYGNSQALFDVSERNQYIDRFQDQAVCTQGTYNGHHQCLQILPYASSIWSNRHTTIPILLRSFAIGFFFSRKELIPVCSFFISAAWK